jgi:HEAT repeat protein
MKTSPFTIIIALLSLAVIGALATLLLSPSPSAPESRVANNHSGDGAKATTGGSLVEDGGWDGGESPDSESEAGQGGEDGVSLVASGDAVVTMTSAQRDAIETTINEAMSTYSAEGVPALEPYLSHPDAAIRSEAIEAMKQIDDPAAAVALRQAAGEEKDSAKRRALLEAADFVELPSLIGAPR